MAAKNQDEMENTLKQLFNPFGSQGNSKDNEAIQEMKPQDEKMEDNNESHQNIEDGKIKHENMEDQNMEIERM